VGASLGAAFGGSLAVTTTSGPGVTITETIGLAVSLELPLLIIDIQRGGPSTGLPTKTEQADLLLAMYGRNGEAPVPIVAPRTPADCFDAESHTQVNGMPFKAEQLAQALKEAVHAH
jgi:2-oxoglutarate ferredoxin oxidoreductase subunit alpha